MTTIKLPSSADKLRAAEVIQKQLSDGRKILSAPPRPEKIRLSPPAFRDAERFFQANKLAVGMKPDSVAADSVKELMAAGALVRTGHARSTRYQLLIRPLDLLRDDSLVSKGVKRPTNQNGAPAAERRSSQILQIDNSTKAYIRENVREYLAFATGAEARKHEERRQSENILDVIHARAKEIVRFSRAGNGPKVLPVTAIAIAQEELAEDFETRLKRKWRPIMFELFGMCEGPDTDMSTMRQ